MQLAVKSRNTVVLIFCLLLLFEKSIKAQENKYFDETIYRELLPITDVTERLIRAFEFYETAETTDQKIAILDIIQLCYVEFEDASKVVFYGEKLSDLCLKEKDYFRYYFCCIRLFYGYKQLGFLEKSTRWEKRGIDAMKKIKGDAFTTLKGAYYGYKFFECMEKNKTDSAYIYIHKSIDEFYKVDGDDLFSDRNIPINYFYLVKFQLANNQLDSALYYNKILAKEAQRDPTIKYLQYNININFSTIYNLEEKYDSALYYLEKAKWIENKYMHVPVFKKDIAESYAAIYEKMGKEDKVSQYKKRSSDLTDSIELDRKIMINATQKLVLKENKQTSTDKYWYWTLASLLVITIGTGVYTYLKIIKHKPQKEESTTKTVEAKNQDSKENLKKYVIKLAKENSPEFIPLFGKLCPDYMNKLLSLEPKLTRSERRLCAMIKLGFQTKEMALYESIKVRAIEVRRNRLRKKLDLDRKENLDKWLEDLV